MALDESLILYYYDFIYGGINHTRQSAEAYFTPIADSYSKEDQLAALHYVERMARRRNDDCTCAGCAKYREDFNDQS